MYTLLTLFFISLAAIILMLGRKVMLVRSGYIVVTEDIPHPFIPDINKVKYFTLKGFKTLIHILTLIVLRVYVKFTNFLKREYQNLKIRIQKLNSSNSVDNLSSKKDANIFLRVVTDYKKKVSAMKEKIHEEEKDM